MNGLSNEIAHKDKLAPAALQCRFFVLLFDGNLPRKNFVFSIIKTKKAFKKLYIFILRRYYTFLRYYTNYTFTIQTIHFYSEIRYYTNYALLYRRYYTNYTFLF